MNVVIDDTNTINVDVSGSSTYIDLDDDQMVVEVDNNAVDTNIDDLELELEIGAQQIPVPDNNHARLYNLDYTNSGHTGFQEEMSALTNLEIEEMFRQ